MPEFTGAALPVPTAAFEVLIYLSVVGIGTICFLLGWLNPHGAELLTVLLLAALIVLAWKRFEQGRHPCFLFLVTLMFFQGGGLLAYALGADNDPLRVQLMNPHPFDVSRDEAGIVLLLVTLTAICIYAPCRWNYKRFSPPSDVEVRRYLPYLYLLFFTTLPVQLFKNYRYYQYIQEHGGYTFYFVNHAALAASVPYLVRAISLITFPVLVAIFVFEQRKKKYVVLATVLYFFTASLILLLGSRVAVFSLILGLWYVARIKSTRKPRILKLVTLALVLLMVGDAVNKLRGGDRVVTPFSLVKVLAIQGISLNVTEVVIKYREVFSPYATSYMLRELRNAFVANDTANYYRGRAVSFDAALLLNPTLFSLGYGTGSSCIAEAYIIGGVVGVVVISVLIGFGLRLAHHFSKNAFGLFVVALVLPDVLIMPRNGLVDWISVLLRSAISILLLGVGWQLYRLLTSIRERPLGDGSAVAIAMVG